MQICRKIGFGQIRTDLSNFWAFLKIKILIKFRKQELNFLKIFAFLADQFRIFYIF